MRLIDADALLEKITQYAEYSHGVILGNMFLREVVDEIEEAPTVDAAPVVHGRWIFEYWKSGYIKRCYCSECGNAPKDAYSPPNYCDNCGAKMDRKDDT